MTKSMSDLTPRAIVEELDRYIVGQKAAKRAVAVALRNRWRRQQVPPPMRDEIAPKNIMLIGPTGVGKTEIARRLAKLASAPFIKLEASKFTEVGYVGRDVDSMVRDLMEVSVKLVRDDEQSKVQRRAREVAEERLLDALTSQRTAPAARDSLRERLRAGRLSEHDVEVEVIDQAHHPVMEVFGNVGLDQMGVDLLQLQKLIGGGQRMKKRLVRVPEA